MLRQSFSEITAQLINYKKKFHNDEETIYVFFLDNPVTHNSIYKCNLKSFRVTNNSVKIFVDICNGQHNSGYENGNLKVNVEIYELKGITAISVMSYILAHFDVDKYIEEEITKKNVTDSYKTMVQPIVATFANQFIQKRQMLLNTDMFFTNQLLISKATEEIARLEKTIESAKKQNDAIYNEVANERQQTIGNLKKSCDCFKYEVVNIAVAMLTKEIK